ncbi:M28 family peptidase [Undibacterium pigrum]|uniref:Zn-dependent M28 family amino/carboxypeptidase n=1 Tax=Undibacterium pigrum TaxID=401470 RepID=A0A318IW95_9BURK|nr:M28 family peptidase [Undibacterium pigrum]PXX39739.1 Zn-dependent M28 family amino/carboxypeptidase [Undibacterium pigrum]
MRLTLTAISSLALHFALAHHPVQAQQVKEAPLRAHLDFLSDDLLEGRGTGQRGGDLAVRYLETQAAAMGLVPLPGTNGYRQTVTLVGSQTLASSQLRFETNKTTLSPAMGAEIVYGSSNGKADNDFNAPLVFVGYGVRAPEERWDDFKGVDLKGKLLIMMVNDPQPTAAEPNRFAGKALTYHGRWTYKYEEAARQGAAGVLLIHTTPSASYAWNVPQTSFSHERFSLDKDGNSGNNGNALEGWLQEDTAKALFAAAGKDLDALRAQAETREFKPVAIDARAHVTLRSSVRKVEQQNVIGMVPGKDAKLKEQAVLYSAHWDHLGIVQEPGKPAQIWNGAVDNASGAAALLAMAQAAVTHPAKRTQIFLWPAAEEQGLLGSAFYVQHPLWPLAKTAADLNLDSMNFVGKTQDMGVAGSEHSSLFNTATSVAKKMGLRIAPPVPDLGGAFFRADHFNFVRAGIPAFNVGSAVFSGDGSFAFDHDAEQEAAQMKAFKKDYHTPRDRYNPAWDLSGMLQQAQFTLNLGYAVANDTAMPAWKKDGRYKRLVQ